MLHIRMDMHKKFSRVEITDKEDKAIDKRVLFHHDQEDIKKYFSNRGQNENSHFRGHTQLVLDL
jgi:hypothetical protein